MPKGREFADGTPASKVKAQLDAAGLTVGVTVIGNPMTVYVRSEALQAMHRAAGDPWCTLPKATVVGGYFTAIVARLIKARRAG